ncbi:MAG: VIT domain-containing protein [Planctomycetota bacterium]
MTAIIRACLVLITLAAALGAQGLPPALLVNMSPDADKPQSEPIQLAAVKVEARIVGTLAETTMTMTFKNPHDRALAGDLYFPLPEGATVSGYALDVNGVMVPGVAVEKDRARQVFEKEVRKGVDPGLVEWTRGNNFKTRVFPIPANGMRTITVSYIADLVDGPDGFTYRLPLAFKTPVGQFSLRIEAVKAVAAPVVKQDGPAGLAFGAWRDSFVAETSLENATLTEDLVVALPLSDKPAVAVEKAPDGQYYFVANVRSPAAAKRQLPAPQSVAIFWDASGSRGGQSHDGEFAVLDTFFKGFRETKLTVDLVIFRNAAEKPVRFEIANGDCGAIFTALKAVACDGGTQLSAATLPADLKPDLVFLFTDGLSNFGTPEPARLDRPYIVVSAAATADHTYLRYLAMKSGGQYFNLARATPAEAAAAWAPAFLFRGATNTGTTDVYPSLPQPAGRKLTFTGRLAADTGTMLLRFGFADRDGTTNIECTVVKADAVEGTLLQRYWAQKKVEELAIDLKRNEAVIIATGKAYGIVTPGTSLLVLETVEQYVTHAIRPPAALAAMAAEYDQIMAEKAKAAKVDEAAKIDRIAKMWQERVTWWETDFKYPKNFRFKGEDETKSARRERDGRGAPSAAAAPASSAEPQAAATGDDAPAEAGELRDGQADTGGAMALQAKADGGTNEPPAAAIVIMEKDPNTPYITVLKKAKPEELFAAYMSQRPKYGTAPSFFLDCADYLLKQKQEALALQVVSNIAELDLENAPLLRVLAHKLAQINQLDLAAGLFEEALRLRPEEPQSWRDLALVLAQKAELMAAAGGTASAECQALFVRAMELMNHVVMDTWDRFDQIEVIALMELNRLIPRAKTAGVTNIPVDPRIVKLMDVDVRIILTWDADMTDMDLWVTEPSGEKAFYGHQRTTIGGNVSRDFTQGYGPEEYCLKKGMPGMYKIEANYYGSSAAGIIGAVTLQVDVFTNYGRPNEQRKSITLRLEEKKETFKVAEIEF